MKTIALITAACSLGALAIPAQAAEPTLASNLRLHHAPMRAAGFDLTARLGDPDWDDDDYRGRRYYNDDDRYERRERHYKERRLSRRDRVWRGRDGRYYCRRGDGTTGLVIGAGVGALLGRTVDTRGDRTLGTLLGAVAGGLLGREIDRGELRCR
jgi:hypothetical protein